MPYPIIPNKSVIIKALFKLIYVNNTPELNAPNAAPIAGKAFHMKHIYH